MSHELKQPGKTLVALLVAAILILQGLFAIWLFTQKQYYHVDEFYSYSLSNGYYTGFARLLDVFPNWVDSEALRRTLTVVDSSTAFQYGSVLYNQAMDVHPPLFYLLFHTVSSVFQGDFSKWTGLIPNLFFLLATSFLIFLILRRITRSVWVSLAAMLFYGFSYGAASTVTFIRMYMMLAFFCTLDVYLHVRLTEKDAKLSVLLPLIFLTTVLGFLTHYYFIIFAFFMSVAYMCVLLLQKCYRGAFLYAPVRLAGVLAGVALFPACLYHIFSSYRGNEAFALLQGGNLLANLRLCVSAIAGDLLPKTAPYVFFALLALAGFTVLYRLLKRTATLHTMLAGLNTVLPVAFAVLCYIVIVAFVAPYKIGRYFFSIYPSIVIVLVLFLVWLARLLLPQRAITPTVTIVLCVLLACSACYDPGRVDYLYADAAETVQAEKTLAGLPGDYVLVYEPSHKWYMDRNPLFYLTAEHILYISNDDLGALQDSLSAYDLPGLKLSIATDLNAEQVLEDVLQQTGFTQVRHIIDAEYTTEYYLFR